jgi:hypothetical protein
MLLLASSGFEALVVDLVEPVLVAVDEVGAGAGGVRTVKYAVPSLMPHM